MIRIPSQKVRKAMARTTEYLVAAKPKMCASMVEAWATIEAKVRPPHNADKNQNIDSTPGKLPKNNYGSTEQTFLITLYHLLEKTNALRKQRRCQPKTTT